MVINSIFTPYLDSNGLVCFLGSDGVTKDGGDTHANEFTLLYCQNVTVDNYFLYKVMCGPDGVPRRHPDTTKWYGRPNRQSRDQLIPRICWAAKWHKQDYFFLCGLLAPRLFLFAFNTKRNFVYDSPDEHTRLSTPDVPYNPAWKLPDLIGPNVHAVLLRGCINHTSNSAKWPLLALIYPLLHLLDLYNLVAVLMLLFGFDKSNDQRNLALPVHCSSTVYPTPISYLTLCLFKLCKPKKIFELHWGQPGEPPIHKVISKLF